jgi:putative peptidoglycan lipid II flippase
MTAVSTLGQRVVAWFQGSVNRRILAAALTVGGISVVVKLVATLRELAVAYQFGTSDAVDAFLIAILIPQLVINVVAVSLTPAFTPVYIETRENEGPAAARDLLASAVAASAFLAVITGLALVLVMPVAFPLLAPGFGGEKLALTRALFYVLLPVVVLNTIATIWAAALNAGERFAVAAVASVCVPLVSLAMILALGPIWGIHALALGTVFGFLLQCVMLGVALKRERLPVVPRWTGVTRALRRVGSQYLPMVAGAALTAGSWAIGLAMAAMLPAGSVASLNYGIKVVSMTTEIATMALATALLPHLSLMVARRDWPAIKKTIRTFVWSIVIVGVPLTMLLIVGSPLIVRLLFQRGAFTVDDTKLVSTIQSLYLLQVPFVMGGMVFVRLASSLQKNHILLWGALITLPLTIVLNLILMRSLGVAGIALATSLIQMVSCFYLALSASRALHTIERGALATPFGTDE